MDPITIYIETDSIISFTLTDVGTPVTTASVTLEITDKARELVGTELTLTHQGSGVYTVTIPHDFGIAEDRYDGWFTIENDGNQAVGRRAIVGEYRAI
jgi:hypothetical protein